MGLLNKILRFYRNDKALKFAYKVNTTFDTLSKKIGDFPLGIFTVCNTRFFLFFRSNISERSIINSKSTKDFWEGLVPCNNEWNFYTNESIQPFLQLFSFQDKEIIKDIAIKAFLVDELPVYFFIANTKEKKITKDFNALIEDFLKSQRLLLKWAAKEKSPQAILNQKDVDTMFYNYFKLHITKTL